MAQRYRDESPEVRFPDDVPSRNLAQGDDDEWELADVPGNDAAKYETAVRADQLLLIVQAPGVEIVRTFQVLRDAHPLELELHPARAVTSN